MGIRQTLGRIGLGMACAAVPAFAGGCHTSRKLTTQVNEMSENLFEGTPQPATNVGCMWKKQIAHLPDPTRDGVQGAGIHGVMNLYAADGLPTKTDGDLQVMAYDETPRVEGKSPSKPSMWHFDPATLKKLRTKDERGMDCTMLFLPWPQDWTDVTKVRIQVKYSPKSGDTSLYTADQVMAFELENQPGQAGNPSVASAKKAIGDKRGIPDLKKTFDLAMGNPPPVVPTMKGDTALVVAPPTMPVVVTTNHVVPVTPTATSAPIQLPANAEPIVSPDPAPLPRPTPPPPPMMPREVTPTPVVPKPETVNDPAGHGLPEIVIPAAR